MNVVVQLTAELNERAYLAEQMQDSIVTLIRHCAGSSATAIVTASQLGRKAANARVQGSLHMRILTPKKTERKWGRLGGSPRSQRRGTRVRKRTLVAWESHLRDGSEWTGRDGRGGGDA